MKISGVQIQEKSVISHQARGSTSEYTQNVTKPVVPTE